MKGLLSYSIELNIAITIFFLIYLISFRRDSNFNIRRIYLLLAMGISIIVPAININFASPVPLNNISIINLEEIFVEGQKSTPASSSFLIVSVLQIAYLLITILFTGKLLLGIVRIIRNARRSEKMIFEGQKIFINREMHASSFFTIIFLDPTLVDKNDLEFILKHETYHARLIHSFDRILSELLISFFWFNPVLWILKKSIVINHEYQADNRVIELGTDQLSYQITILNQYIGSASISNQFSNQIKNRIKMLNKNYKKGSFWKSIMLFPISLALLLVMSCNNQGTKNEMLADDPSSADEEIFYVVEDMPQWPGSDDMVLSVRKFIAENLIYPPEAAAAGAEGKVFVHFIVTNTGKVVIPDPSQLPMEKEEDGSEHEVVVVGFRPLNIGLSMPDEKMIQLFKDESVRVINLMPELIPGKQGGKAVNVIFTMPITFKLQ